MKSPNSSIAAKVTNFLTVLLDEEMIEKIARSSGFVQKRSKISGMIFAMMLIFEIRRQREASLNELCSRLSLEGVLLSKQGLDNRFNDHAVIFMKQLMDKALTLKLDREQLLDNAGCFNRIMIKDSTVFQLPQSCVSKYEGSGGGASEAGIKLQYEYDLKASEELNIQAQPSISPDNIHYLKNFQPGDLCLEDLGYANHSHLEDIIEKQAYFLTRMKYSTAVYVIKDGQYYCLDIDNLISKMKPGEIIDRLVYLGKVNKVPVRMVLERVPDEVAAQKRRKLKTDKQNKRKAISKGRLAFCDVNAYITNAQEKLLQIHLIRSIYSLRWQIEIIFKTWKSTFNLDKVNRMSLQRFECLNYGTLLQIIICTKLFNYYKTILWNSCRIELSELKSMKYLQLIVSEIKIHLHSKAFFRIKKLLDDVLVTLKSKCVKELRKGRQTPMMILEKLSLA
jgi:hypothetical protein